MPETTASPNIELIVGLRELADFLEAHPETKRVHVGTFNLFAFGHDPKAQLAQFAKIAGHVEKDSSTDYFWLRKIFPGGIALEFNASRAEVCERVQVGTTVEPEHVIPAQPETVVPAREVPTFEWRCGSILAETEVAA